MNYTLLKNKMPESGRSMIEMLGVLAIIGVLSVSGIAGFSKAMESYKTNQCIEQISTIIANVKNLGLRQHGSYKGLSTKAAKKMKLFPEEMMTEKNSDIVLNHPFGGSVEVGTGKTLSSTKHTAETDFLITYYSLPKETCLQIMAKNWGEKRIGLIAAADTDTMKSAVKNFEHSTTPKCETKTKYATCTDKQMPLANATSGCDCGKEHKCAVTVWSF